MTALPGLTPRSPLTVVAPVLVTVEPPSTENVLNWADALEEPVRSAVNPKTRTVRHWCLMLIFLPRRGIDESCLSVR